MNNEQSAAEQGSTINEVPRTIRRVCVFCGSNPGQNPRYAAEAKDVGKHLAARGWGLVYGGGRVGLMGIVADAVLEAGGEVIGVIPEMLATKELKHTGATAMHVTPNMHTRKAMMAEHADAFIAMPGGFGTFEEVMEITTWAQLGLHRKPIGLLNVSGFYERLSSFIDHATREGFIKSEQRDLVFMENNAASVVDRLVHHQMPTVRKWIASDET